MNTTLGGALHHVGILTDDFDTSMRFYQEVLGFTTLMEWSAAGPGSHVGRVAYVDSGNGACLELFELLESDGKAQITWRRSGEKVHICLSTDKIEEVLEAARAFGVNVIGELDSIELRDHTGVGTVTARLCFLQGPAGETVELISGIPTLEQLGSR